MFTKISNRKILIVDDNDAIHEDFRKILCQAKSANNVCNNIETHFFGSEQKKTATNTTSSSLLQIDSAFQGQEALELVKKSIEEKSPYAMAFVDMRMPPGWNGLETISRIWEVDPKMQVVICTAFSDYSWEETIEQLGETHQLLVIKKPFDAIEARQAACAMMVKWDVHRQAEMKLDEMEIRVSERTKEIQAAQTSLISKNEKLSLTHSKTEADGMAKSRLLTKRCQEVKTNAANIVALARERHDNSRSDTERATLKLLCNKSEFNLSLLNDVYDLSQFDWSNLTLQSKTCSLVDLVNEVIEMMEFQGVDKGLTLNAKVIGKIPATFESDPTRFKQIFVNLLDNAIQYTESGNVSLEIKFVSQAAATDMLQFDVVDTGNGIDSEQMSSLTHPDLNDHFVASVRLGCSGIGLTISRRLVSLLGGTFKVESEPGIGSTFSVLLPVEKSSVDEWVEDIPQLSHR